MQPREGTAESAGQGDGTVVTEAETDHDRAFPPRGRRAGSSVLVAALVAMSTQRSESGFGGSVKEAGDLTELAPDFRNHVKGGPTHPHPW